MSLPLDLIFKLGAPVHVWLYRATGGQLLNRGAGSMPILLLTTLGRRSGRARTVPVCYMPDGRDIVVMGSAGGSTRTPAWALNARANPAVTVQIGSHVTRARAEWTQGAERDRLWAAVTNRYPFFFAYERRSGREIPVVKLTRGA